MPAGKSKSSIGQSAKKDSATASATMTGMVAGMARPPGSGHGASGSARSRWASGPGRTRRVSASRVMVDLGNVQLHLHITLFGMLAPPRARPGRGGAPGLVRDAGTSIARRADAYTPRTYG